jgi:hypothetical protein
MKQKITEASAFIFIYVKILRKFQKRCEKIVKFL